MKNTIVMFTIKYFGNYIAFLNWVQRQMLAKKTRHIRPHVIHVTVSDDFLTQQFSLYLN